MEITSSKEGNRDKSYFAFFDLDHTLISAVSGQELALGAYKRGLMKNADLLIAISLSLLYKFRLVDPGKAINKMGRWVKGITVEELEKLCAGVTSEVLIPSVYKKAREEIRIHKDKKAGLVILSSTLRPVASIMSEYLGMDEILCSELEAVYGILTGLPVGAFCFREEKVVRLKQYCEINNSKLKDAWYYGDSISDLPALSIVGHPVCINPDKKLKRVALKNSWKIYYWKNKNEK
jgi:putative phosphoserine phosphatase/1-acylglycerol-3-phosphate O-acyltransferase